MFNKLRKRQILIFVIFVIFIFFFSFRSNSFIDPDFGWHLRFGEIVKQTKQIPIKDIFSYTMPSYSFVNHEWGSDLLLAYLYPVMGQMFLSILFSLILASSLLLLIREQTEKYFLFPFVLGLFSLLSFAEIRPQILSFFFFSLLLAILIKESKLIFLLPLLFLLWANLHGAFVVGLFAFGVMCFAKSLRKRGVVWRETFLFFFSVLITFLNPYGVGLWKEIFITFFDSRLRFSVQEWLPSLFFFNLPYIFLVVLSLSLVFRYLKKFYYGEIMLYFVFLVLSLSSSRNLVYFVLISLVVIPRGLFFMEEEAAKYVLGRERFRKAFYFFLSIFFIFLFLNFSRSIIFPNNSQDAAYPSHAIAFLKENPSKGEIFSIYNWGGYLIWKLPEKKVFIDGRMPSWRSQPPIPTESPDAFSEYSKMLVVDVPLALEVKKYNIDTFLLPSQVPPPSIISKFIESKFHFKNYDQNVFFRELQKNGFTKIYEDRTAIVFRKT